jgi:hypothetical protein
MKKALLLAIFGLLGGSSYYLVSNGAVAAPRVSAGKYSTSVFEFDEERREFYLQSKQRTRSPRCRFTLSKSLQPDLHHDILLTVQELPKGISIESISINNISKTRDHSIYPQQLLASKIIPSECNNFCKGKLSYRVLDAKPKCVYEIVLILNKEMLAEDSIRLFSAVESLKVFQEQQNAIISGTIAVFD